MNAENDEWMAFLNIIKIISNFKGFREWLEKYHKIKDPEPFFEGYRYLVLVSTQWFIETMTYYSPLKLKISMN